MGVSKGGMIGCWYGADNPKVKRILTVNAPLMIDFHNRTLPAIKKLCSKKLTMVYGSLDPSYRFIDFAKQYVTIKIIEGADHQFRGYTPMFEKLATELLMDNEGKRINNQITLVNENILAIIAPRDHPSSFYL